MSKIDIEKFICSLRKELCETQYFELIRIIDTALEEQGYEYKDGEIVEIEEQNPLTEEQKAFIDECLKNGSMIRWSDLAYADEGKPDTIHFDKEPEKEEEPPVQFMVDGERRYMPFNEFHKALWDYYNTHEKVDVPPLFKEQVVFNAIEGSEDSKKTIREYFSKIMPYLYDIDIDKMVEKYVCRHKGFLMNLEVITYRQGLEDMLNLIKKGGKDD